LVLAEVATVAVTGTIMGLLLAAALGRLIESQLFGIRAYDPLTIALALAALSVVVAAAAFFPARRAATVDPVTALRSE